MNRPLILITTYIPCWTVEPNAKVTWGLGRGEGVDAGVGQSHVEEGVSTKLLGLLVEVAKEELVWVILRFNGALCKTTEHTRHRETTRRHLTIELRPRFSDVVVFSGPDPDRRDRGSGWGTDPGSCRSCRSCPGWKQVAGILFHFC